MSGETEKDESGWTVDTLRYYMTQRFADQEKLLDERYATQTKAVEKAFAAADLAVQAALTSAEKAVSKAEMASDKRFDAVNEFRSALTDQTATFIPRTEALGILDRHAEDIKTLTDRINVAEGKGMGISTAWIVLLGAVAALGTVVSLYVAAR